MSRKLNDPWTAYVVGRMHRMNLTNQELATACNYSACHLSSVLHCNKKFRSDESLERTKNVILTALAELEEEILCNGKKNS